MMNFILKCFWLCIFIWRKGEKIMQANNNLFTWFHHAMTMKEKKKLFVEIRWNQNLSYFGRKDQKKEDRLFSSIKKQTHKKSSKMILLALDTFQTSLHLYGEFVFFLFCLLLCYSLFDTIA